MTKGAKVKDALIKQAMKSEKSQGKSPDLNQVSSYMSKIVSGLEQKGKLNSAPAPAPQTLVTPPTMAQLALHEKKMKQLRASGAYLMSQRIKQIRMHPDQSMRETLKEIAVNVAGGSEKQKKHAQKKLALLLEKSNRVFGHHWMQPPTGKLYF